MRTYTDHAARGDTERMPPQRRVFNRRRRGHRGRVLAMLAAIAAALACALIVAGVLMSSTTPSSPTASVPSAGHDDGWMLVLVNDGHPMDPYQPELTDLRDGQSIDSRCYPDLQWMFDAARAAGFRPKVNSSYRSRDEQQSVLDEAIASYAAEGLSAQDARQRALRTVAEPGTSEHETGLAIDVTSESQAYEDNMAVWDWMSEHSWQYGWILRYPEGKADITGIDNEPWHFRYVGIEAAREMHESGQCLEEYLGQA